MALVVFSAMSITPIQPKTIVVDDGCVRIVDGNRPFDRAMAEVGYPISDKDLIFEIDKSYHGDKLLAISRAKQIQIADYNEHYTLESRAMTVRDLMREEKDILNLGELDRVEPSPEKSLKDQMEIKITRVRTEDVLVEEPAEPSFRMVTDDKLPRGKIETVSKGTPGLKEVVYRKYYKNDEHTLTQKVSERVVVEPVPGVQKVGSRVMVMSRSGYRGNRILEMEATAYDAGPKSTGRWADGRTATGKKARYGIVAVDPEVIPLGTRMFIEGYGYAVAEDVGGAIKGLRIDLFFESRSEALKFGRRTVKVYILDDH